MKIVICAMSHEMTYLWAKAQRFVMWLCMRYAQMRHEVCSNEPKEQRSLESQITRAGEKNAWMSRGGRTSTWCRQSFVMFWSSMLEREIGSLFQEHAHSVHWSTFCVMFITWICLGLFYKYFPIPIYPKSKVLMHSQSNDPNLYLKQ